MGPVSFAVQEPESDQGTLRFNRRVVLKAAAILAGITGASVDATDDRSWSGTAAAESETIGFDWYESDQLGPVGGAGTSTAPIVLKTQFPFTAVGAHWEGSTGDWPSVHVQFSYDGFTWSEVFILAASHDEGQPNRDGRRFTGLVCAEGARHIAYAVYDPDGNRVTLPGFALTYIDSSAGPDLDAVGGVGAASTDPSRPPRIITRSEWGANESYRFTESGEWWTLRYALVRHAIVHHTETSNVEQPLQAIRAVQYYHAVTRGWYDIGYNFLVDRFGNIYQGRVGGQNVVGGHAFAFANGSSGISFIGNHNFANVSSSALAGMVAIVAWAVRFRDPFGRSAFQGLANLPTICGHRDVLSTSCPGDLAYPQLATIRSLVAQTLANQPGGPAAGLVVGDFVVTNSGVNLRTQPGLSSTVILLLQTGVDGVVFGGPVFQDGSAWYQVATDYATGWAVANALTVDPQVSWKKGRFGRAARVSLNDSANLRRLPSVNGALIRSLPTGTSAEVLGGPEDADLNRWYKVSTSLGEGWVAARFLGAGGSGVPVPPPSSAFAIGDAVVVADGPVNMRGSAATSAAILTQLSTGATGTIVDGPSTGYGYTWFRVNTGALSGWVASSFLAKATASGRFSAGDQISVSSGPLNLRSAAGTTSSIIAQLATAAAGSILAGPVSASGYTWYRLQTSSGIGWAAQDFLSSAAPSPSTPTSTVFNTSDDAIVTSGPLNLRAAPGSSATVLAQLPQRARCVIRSGPQQASGYSWYQVQSGILTGWVVVQFLAHGPRIGSTATVFTGNGSLRIRSSAGTGASIVATIPDGTTSTVLAGPQSLNGYTWWRIQSAAGTGWAAGAFLIPS
ncbi:hypothetical protein BH23CHL5_BH23CHL5_04250 [soil metagenome]